MFQPDFNSFKKKTNTDMLQPLGICLELFNCKDCAQHCRQISLL